MNAERPLSRRIAAANVHLWLDENNVYIYDNANEVKFTVKEVIDIVEKTVKNHLEEKERMLQKMQAQHNQLQRIREITEEYA